MWFYCSIQPFLVTRGTWFMGKAVRRVDGKFHQTNSFRFSTLFYFALKAMNSSNLRQDTVRTHIFDFRTRNRHRNISDFRSQRKIFVGLKNYQNHWMWAWLMSCLLSAWASNPKRRRKGPTHFLYPRLLHIFCYFLSHRIFRPIFDK